MRRGAIGISSLDSDRAWRENLAKQDSLFFKIKKIKSNELDIEDNLLQILYECIGSRVRIPHRNATVISICFKSDLFAKVDV